MKKTFYLALIFALILSMSGCLEEESSYSTPKTTKTNISSTETTVITTSKSSETTTEVVTSTILESTTINQKATTTTVALTKKPVVPVTPTTTTTKTKAPTTTKKQNKFVIFWGNTGNKLHIKPNCKTITNGVLNGSMEQALEAGHDKGWCQVCSKGWTDEKYFKDGNPYAG